MTLGHVFFGLRGRASRSKYWLVSLTWSIIGAIALGILTAFMDRGAVNAPDEQIVAVLLSYGLGFLSVVLVIGIPALISNLAISIKRLHDRNKSGAWVLLYYFAPALLYGIATVYVPDIPVARIALLLAAGAIALWTIFELGVLRGTVGPNQYGPDPLDL